MNWNDLSIEELEKWVREHNRRYFIEHQPVISPQSSDGKKLSPEGRESFDSQLTPTEAKGT